jgi:hypothetical protein
VPASADDDVVVHGDAKRCCDVDDRLGHLDVGLRRRRVAGGVVVHHNYRAAKNERLGGSRHSDKEKFRSDLNRSES